MLEIGGASGFGLSAAAAGAGAGGLRPLAAGRVRRAQLGLDIAQAYFGEANLGGTYDMVLATEMVEHPAEPPGSSG